MKIEKINENQIRCILTKEDLASRQIRLSELAYGSDKARSLFADMMQQASYQYGFDAEDIPLMIEAIPMSAESVILVISKVEYPEELDTRFSRFSEGAEEAYYDDYIPHSNSLPAEGADDILDLFRKIREEHEKGRATGNLTDADFVPLSQTAPVIEEVDPSSIKAVPNDSFPFDFDITKLYVFRSIDEILRLSAVLQEYYEEENTLFKNPANSRYYLTVRKGHHTPEEYNKICNILAEYAVQIKYTAAEEAYFREHYETILTDRALQTLATI